MLCVLMGLSDVGQALFFMDDVSRRDDCPRLASELRN